MSHFHPHTHEHYTIAQLTDHLRRYHETVDVTLTQPHGEDEHDNAVAKVSMGDCDSARIDVHPWAVPLFKNAEVVFASIEGVQKADAILSQIRRHNLRASVYSVPSVTLWNDPKTTDFVDTFLRGKTVIVIPDADWADPSKKGAVENQARIYHGRLVDFGVSKVHVAAAPDSFFKDTGDKGIDDYLGQGGTLEQMVCFDVEPPNRRTVLSWVNRAYQSHVGHPPTNQYARTLAGTITSLSMFASSRDGEIRVSQGLLANVLGVTRQSIGHRLGVLGDLKAIEYDGSFAVSRNYFGGWDWEDQPEIRIVADELRATMLPKRLLVDVLGESFFRGTP